MEYKPVGKLKVVGTKFKQTRDLAVYTTIYLEDENGEKWEYDTASMIPSLKKTEEKKPEKECSNKCSKNATYVRRTQFSGDHYFCTDCAKKEKDFAKEDSSYFVWEKIKK
jgi:hypothetical protein